SNALELARQNEQKARDEAARANAERDRAVAVTEFVTSSLRAQDPNNQGTQGITVADAMNQALAKLEKGELNDQPDTLAHLLMVIAEILDGNGRSTEAEAPAARALEILTEAHKGDDAGVAAAMAYLAGVRESLGRLAEAEPLYTRALEMQQRLT